MIPPIPPINANGHISQSTGIQEPMDKYYEASTNGNGSSERISPAASAIPEVTPGFDPSISWDMVGLGLEEPLPTQQAIDEL